MERIISNPTIIDIEASGFGAQSYPIEVGIVRNDGALYCRLIKPFDDWQHWQKSAQDVHGITRQQSIAHGIDGVQMCLELNEFLGESTAYSDGWAVDSMWIIRLFSRAKINMTFHVSSLEMILKESQMSIWHTTKEQVIQELALKRHRASNDAVIIQHTYNRTLTA